MTLKLLKYGSDGDGDPGGGGWVSSSRAFLTKQTKLGNMLGCDSFRF